MFRCVRSFEHGGIAYRAGLDRVSEDADVMRHRPEMFKEVTSGPGFGQRSEVRAQGRDDQGRGVAFTGTDLTLARAREMVRDELRDEIRRAEVRSAAGDAGNLEGPDEPTKAARRRKRGSRPGGEHREAALRALEARAAEFEAPAGDRIEKLIRSDRAGLDSAYFEAVSDEAYEGAFWKRLANPDSAHLAMTSAEAEATRRVARATEMRSMAEGEGATGGFGVPLALDPTIVLTSSVSPDVPLRQLATVVTIATREWKGVSSEGVTASFSAEGTEVGDGSPTLVQPAIKAEKYQVFVPFSIEVGMDYQGGLQQELGGLLADARGAVEADRFTYGTAGANEPGGFLVGATATVSTAATATFAAADVYTLQEALGPRFQGNATFVSSLGVANDVWRMVPTGSTTSAALFNDARTQILGRPWTQVSTMGSATTSGSKLMAYGDFARGYRIVDRIGMSVELIPHLFGKSNQRPTGQRGIYAYGRVGAGVVNANALRVLKSL